MSGSDFIGGPCPFHKGGQERKPSFYMSLDTGYYFCHACKVKGTFVQFLRIMGAPRQLIDHVFDTLKNRPQWKSKPVEAGFNDIPLRESLLGILDYCPVNLVKAGFNKALLQKLDIGFDREDQRITFPIRDLHGRLVGIAGRTTCDAYPRYKIYKESDIVRLAGNTKDAKTEYAGYNIGSHNFLWNAHNVYPIALAEKQIATLIIVEGYKACIWLMQNGHENVVALQGSYLSKQQETLISRLRTKVVLFLDKNEAGVIGTLDAGWRLIKTGMEVYCCEYPPNTDEHAQPDSLNQPELNETIQSAKDWTRWRIACDFSPRTRNAHNNLPKE
jgi:DNA primase